jgi:alpha/beta superfamily hydrolase
MHNKVVHTLARTFERWGAAAVRFNFRGVGRSEGNYGEGEGEVADALAVGGWIGQRWAGLPLYMAGFSFGAMVALRAADTLAARALVTVAPPAAKLSAAHIAAPHCPWLLLQGDKDQVTPMSELVPWLAGLSRAPELHVLREAEHFFHGRLGEIAASVERFLDHLQETGERGASDAQSA